MSEQNKETRPCGHSHEHEHDHAHGCCGQEHEHEHACCGHEHHHDHEHECCGHEHHHEHKHGASCSCGHSHGDGCGCGHDHGREHERGELIVSAVQTGAAIVIVAAAGLAPMPLWLSLVLHLVAYALVGREVIERAVQGVLHGEWFDENFLMAVATVGAFAVGEWAEAVAVMIFYNIGETLQDLAIAKSRANIAGLMDIRPEFARVVRGAAEEIVSPERVSVGDVIRIQPGERVPLDCEVLSGEGSVDASALTGESMPVLAKPGVSLASGSVALSGLLECRVTSVFAESTVQKILQLVSESGEKKAQAEKFITRFSKVYTPVVMALAALIAVVPPLFLGFDTFFDWFYRGLIFLVVSCPCALVISIPVSFLGGIGGAAKNGILVKGGDVIDRLRAPAAVVFDKTGTLTQGKFSVRRVVCADGVSEGELLAAAALCERNSNHPIAVSVREYCAGHDGGETIDSYEEKAGYGITAGAGGHTYASGNAKLMEHVGAQLPGGAEAELTGTVIHIAKDGRWLGSLSIADEVKPGAREAVEQLRALGVKKCCMLTGDSEPVARAVAEAVGLDEYRAGLLPHEKVAAYEEVTKGLDGVSLYTGDGINDAPLLARADVGVAMGGVGSDAAIEAADLVLMTDEPGKIAAAVRIARHTHAIVRENIVFALGVKAVVLVLAALGYTPMWLAIFADVGVALLAVANAARAVRVHG